MDKPTSLFIIPMRLLAGLWLVAAATVVGFAQDGPVGSGDGQFVPEIPASYSGAGSFFNRKLGTAFRFSYHNEGYGTQDGVVTLGTMKVFSQEGSTIFLDGQATLSDDFGGGFNTGIGYRKLANLGFGPDPKRINGISFWADGQSTSADNFFSQLGVAGESLGDSFDVRFQGNFPLQRTKDSDRRDVAGAMPVFEGDALLGALQQFTRDTALTVLDLEGAKRIRDLEAWAFAGAYHLTGSGTDATGYRAGVRGYAVPDVSVSLQITDDDIYHTNLVFGLTWFVGRTNRCNQPCGTLLDRFREPVLRNDYIATTQQIIYDPIDPLSDAVSNEQFVFVHVDSNAAAGGDGTIENPYQTLAEAEAGSSDDNIVFVHSGTLLAGAAGQFATKDGQRVLGEGLDPNGIFIDHTVNSAEQGLVSLPETSPGSQGGTAPVITGLGIVFDLADHTGNEINNFVINGGVTAVSANLADSPQLANLDINNPTGDAIVFTDVTGSSLIENSVTIDGAVGRAIFIDGGSGVLGANAMINNSAGLAVEVTNRDSGSVTFGEITDTGLGVFVHDNTGGTITFSSLVDLNTGANPAVRLTDNSGSTITFQELQATSSGGNTFVVTGGGTISVNDPNSDIINTGAGSALVVSGDDGAGTGDPSVTILGDITNTGTGRVVDIQDMTDGAVSITGDVTDNGGTGSGILVENNTGGTFSFAGTTDLSTGANNAVKLHNNDGTTTTFTDLRATAAAGNTFDVEGGGTITVNDPNDSGMIANTGTGTAVRIAGDGLATEGDPTVNIASDIVNSGGGRAVDIQDMTGGGVTITGDVTDPNSDGLGILVEDNTAGTISFAGTTTLDTGLNDAVTLTNNDGATITFSNLNATAAAGDTFVVEGGGTITVNDPNDTGMIANTGTGSALVISGDNGSGTGNPTVNIASDIVNSGGGRAVDIQDMTGGGVTITGDVTDPNSDGMGILVEDNTAGTYSFTGTTTLDTGVSNAVTLRNNDGATVTFSNLNATAAAGNTFVVEGGGTITVNDPNDTGMIANTGTGTAVRIRGDDFAGATGDPTVSIASNVTNTVGGMSVDIQDMTAGGVTFSGLVGDPNSTDDAVLIQNNTGGTFIFTDTLTVNTGNNDAVSLISNTGATLSFNGLDITATGAVNKGFTATGGGNLTVSNANPTTITTEMDSALDIDGMTISAGNVTFDTVTQTAGTSTGVILRDLDGTGSVTVGADAMTPGTITSSNGGVLIDGGTNNITVNTGIATTGAHSLEVINRTGGTVSVTGDISDTDMGINLANNTGGTVNITGAMTLDTGGNDAITISGNDGASINFTGTSSIDLVATTGSGVHLTGTNTDVDVDADITGSTAGAAGPAVDVEGDATLVVDGNITTTNGRSVQVHNVTAGTVTFNGDINDTDEGISIDTNTGGTVNFNGMVTLNTGADDAVTIQSNSSGNTVNFNGASQLDIDTTSGTGIVINGPGTVNINGTGNTIDSTTTGVGIDITNAESATINNTTINTAGDNAVNVTHNNAAASVVTLNNLTVASAGGSIGVNIFAGGSGEFDVRMDNVDISGVGLQGIVLDTGANADRVDFTITDSLIVAVDSNAFLATLNDSDTADVRFLIVENQFSNNSDATGTDSAAFEISVTSGMTLNATIGNGPNNQALPTAPIGDRNRFVNTSANGDAFLATINDGGAGGILNLDLRDNTAQSSGSGLDFGITNTMGTFNLVDETDTKNGDNNVGTVTDSGTINQIAPPLLMPTP